MITKLTCSKERCALDIPSNIYIAAENQRANGEYVAANGGGVFLMGDQTQFSDVLAETVQVLFHDHRALTAMSKAAMQICNGTGARRVAHKIVKLATA